MYSTNIRPKSEVRGTLPLRNPKPEGLMEYTVLAVVHTYDIYYGDITLGCRADDVTIKTTYNNVLYLFIESSTLFAPALADLKETLMLHVINEFKFQQAIHEKEEFVQL